MALGAVAIIASTVNAKRNGSNNSDAKETSSVSVHEEFAADFDYMECELNHTNNISECYIAYEEYEFDDYESEVDTGTDWGYPEGLE